MWTSQSRRAIRTSSRPRNVSVCAPAMLARDPEIARTLITHRYPIIDTGEAFRVAGDKASGAIRVVIEPT
jgi:threonine dehydrogenase-like Zn-dependent dehydrogenase